jgi:hypothetical protein
VLVIASSSSRASSAHAAAPNRFMADLAMVLIGDDGKPATWAGHRRGDLATHARPTLDQLSRAQLTISWFVEVNVVPATIVHVPLGS